MAQGMGVRPPASPLGGPRLGPATALRHSDTKLSTKQSVAVLTEVSSAPAMGGTFWQGEMDTVDRNTSGPAATGSYGYGGTPRV
jgi:hypothetical protein